MRTQPASLNELKRRPISGLEERVLLAFAQYLSHRMSPASVAAYQSDVRLFAENTPGVDLFRFGEAQEDAYIDTLHRMRRTPRTIQRKGTAFRYFREFLTSSGLRRNTLQLTTDDRNLPTDQLTADEAPIPQSKSVIDRTIQAFLRSLRSRSTLRAYTSDLLKFRQSLQGKTGWHHVHRQLITDFIDQQITSGLNANSAARLLSTLRSLFRWLRQNGYTLGNPILGLQLPRAKNHAPTPSVKAFSAMASTQPPSSFSGLRDLLIFELLYRLGLRVSEVSALDVSSVDLTQRKLRVRGRCSRQRYIDIPESSNKLLVEYRNRGEISDSDSHRPLVTNLRGGRLTTRSIGRIIAQMAASRRLPEGMHPHSVRQAGASHSLKSGKDIQGIRHDLGISGVSPVC